MHAFLLRAPLPRAISLGISARGRNSTLRPPLSQATAQSGDDSVVIEDRARKYDSLMVQVMGGFRRGPTPRRCPLRYDGIITRITPAYSA